MNDALRAKRIRSLLDRIGRGEDVAQRELRSVLTVEQRHGLQAMWIEQKEFKRPDKPGEIIDYERLLQRALMTYGRFNRSSARRITGTNKKAAAHSEAVKRMRAKADREFEVAHEALQEMLAADPSLLIWLDRNVSWEHGESPSLDPIDMPRAITSRSQDRMGGLEDRFPIKSKREVKKMVLEDALVEVQRNLRTPMQKAADDEIEQKQMESIKRKLAEIGKRRY
ncbi:MAG: hypothetical protein O2845_07335 [Proteobacteria bacterium]|nr:hypothetical protein [Pseudomonadota bacterium]